MDIVKYILSLIFIMMSFVSPTVKSIGQNILRKTIVCNPAGLHGFYVLGTCQYIKDNYDISDYEIYGASAGSWNSLLLTNKDNDYKFIDRILNVGNMKHNTLMNLQLNIRDNNESLYLK